MLRVVRMFIPFGGVEKWVAKRINSITRSRADLFHVCVSVDTLV